MPQFVLIANPHTRRVELFQNAVRNYGLPPAILVPYEDLLTGKVDLTEFDSGETIFRFDAPERNFTVDRGFISQGANEELNGDHQRISATEAMLLPEQLGRIYYPHQWYLGWRKSLKQWTSNLQGKILNHPDDIGIMFDKIQCQKILRNAGIPVPLSLFEDTNNRVTIDRLKEQMITQNIPRVFIKLAHGSSASGVVAYEFGAGRERAITTVERIIEEGELRFYNSRLIRQYYHSQEITDIIDFLSAESVQIEQWLPKARLGGKEFDLRVVVINQRVYQSVIRVGNSPMTNLHLGNDRREISDLPKGLSQDHWLEMLSTCEKAAACFPRSFYCGVDLLIAPNLKDHYILEINAFGDLLQGITWEGEDTYSTQIRLLINNEL
jgi:glutathione synthase/RimK-type ligase-like ATP-grasp enzyme